MSDLITRNRALWNLGNRSTSAGENTTIDALIAAVSRAIERYCQRTFAATEFDELYDGNDQDRLLLKQFPVLRVDRVAACPTAVLKITNTSGSNQRAAVA